MSPNLYPGIRDEDVLLGCGEDTPELNIQVVEHAECRLRYLFSSYLGYIISPVSLISLIYIIYIIFFNTCSGFVRLKRTSVVAVTLSDTDTEDDTLPKGKDSATKDDDEQPRYNSKGLRVNANGVVSMR